MSTVASLSFFSVHMPAGVLADKVDRQKLVCTINLCLAATTLGLACLVGCTFSILTSSWVACFSSELVLLSTHQPGHNRTQVVSDVELPSAATLSGLQLNISGIIGPALGGLLVPLAGAKFV